MSSAMRKRIFEASAPIIKKIDDQKLLTPIGAVGYLSEATLKLIESNQPKSTSVYYV
jgi:hypothetical protein